MGGRSPRGSRADRVGSGRPTDPGRESPGRASIMAPLRDGARPIARPRGASRFTGASVDPSASERRPPSRSGLAQLAQALARRPRRRGRPGVCSYPTHGHPAARLAAPPRPHASGREDLRAPPAPHRAMRGRGRRPRRRRARVPGRGVLERSLSGPLAFEDREPRSQGRLRDRRSRAEAVARLTGRAPRGGTRGTSGSEAPSAATWSGRRSRPSGLRRRWGGPRRAGGPGARRRP